MTKRNKNYEMKTAYYKLHLDRRRGYRGRKLGRLSLGSDLIRLGRKLAIKVERE